MKIIIHFIEEKSGKMIAKRLMNHAPRKEDEIRLGGEGHETYWQITKVIWCLDEESPYERLNIGVRHAE